MMKKKLKYEITEYSIYVQGLTRGREQREYLSWKTVTEMLKEFFETCKDVKSQTFEDLKAIYEIREDPRPDDRYGEEIFLKNMFRLYQIIYQVQSYDDPLINKNDFNLEEFINRVVKRRLDTLDVY